MAERTCVSKSIRSLGAEKAYAQVSMCDWLLNYELVIDVEQVNRYVVHIRRRPQAAKITFCVEGKEITMLSMTDTQQAVVTLKITDKKGKPAQVEGAPVWASGDDEVCTVTDIAADGLSATVKAVGSGLTQVQVTADADLGAGVKPIIGFLDVTIQGQATIIELVPGTPTEQ